MDSYSTYVIVENLSSPGDFALIHVRFKVVSRQGAQFSVIADGKATSVNPVIDYGGVYYDQFYENRSFIIVNESSMALDFLVGEDVRFLFVCLFCYGIFSLSLFSLSTQVSTNLSPMNPSEVNFSLSRTSLNLFSIITIDAMSEQRVYLHFVPRSRQSVEDGEGQCDQMEFQICKKQSSRSSVLCSFYQ
jgi:hypothetical protein